MESTKSFILGMFDDEEQMMGAASKLKSQKIKIDDIYTPFPVHGLDDYLDIKRSRLPIVTFFAAIIGLIAAMYFQIWTSAQSWPLNVGGKPFNSFVAFIPVGFEIMILFGALITVVAFLFRAKLFPGKEPCILHPNITDNLFVVSVECSSAKIDANNIKSIFKTHGASNIKAVGVIQ